METIIPVFAIILILATSSDCLNNGLARTPPMGWMAWARFGCNTNCKASPKNCVSAQLLMDMADHLVSDGFKDVGYEYVNLDDCWMAHTRDASGKLQADPKRFPQGIKGLADYIHSKGLKLGLYADYGTRTCAGFPGSYGHLELDAQTFAEWGVDSLKMDGCNSDIHTMNKAYPEMSSYLNATGRPILFSCSWPDYLRHIGLKPNWTQVAENCNMWRFIHDIKNSYMSVLDIIMQEAGYQYEIAPVVKPGSFNDPDMLIIGNTGLNIQQARAQFAMSAVMAAPLLMSNDLRQIDPAYVKVLQTKDVIAINQDPLGLMGVREYLYVNQSVLTAEIWTRKLSNNSFASAILSRTLSDFAFVFTNLTTMNIVEQEEYELINVYSRRKIGTYGLLDTIELHVPASGVILVKAIPTKVTKSAKFDTIDRLNWEP